MMMLFFLLRTLDGETLDDTDRGPVTAGSRMCVLYYDQTNLEPNCEEFRFTVRC